MESETADATDEAVENNSNSPSSNRASVTIVSRESLPTYSSERFFLLSEIEEHAAKPVFYLETDAADESTADTKEESLLDQGQQSPTNPPGLAQFLILYVLWQHPQKGTVKDEEIYVRNVLVPYIEQLEQHVSLIVPEESNLQASISSASCASGIERVARMEDSSSNTDPQLPKAHVYLVVERVVHHANEGGQTTATAEQDNINDADTRLTQAIASHPLLRNTLQGVTVATANHTRAAPGIEAMYQAIAITGARDRRRNSTSEGNNNGNKSLLQVVTPSLSHIVPSAQADSPDAAENVQQTRVAAEWNGRGTLETFAQTAHGVWLERNGITQTMTTHRKVPRRWVKQQPQQHAMAYITAETVYDVAAMIMVVAYAMYHFW